MKSQNARRNTGSITLDFMFGIVLVAGVSFILTALCMTMAMVEIAQYVSFASARSYFGAHKNEKLQISRAEEKFNKLLGIRDINHVLRGDWFGLKYLGTGDFRSLYPPKALEHDSDTFFGTRLEFEAKLLHMRIPFLGTTEEGAYKANVASYLGREPNFEECMEFTRQRWDRFSQRFPLSAYANRTADDVYAVIMDNGC